MKKINIFLGIISLSFLLSGYIISGQAKENKTLNPPVGLNIGNQAPELEFQDPNGKAIKLSSLRGNLVLVDFWASWCGPCRMENPNVVNAFNKFNNKKFKEAKSFVIYNVSLDKNKQNWINAIQQDGLTWPYHVSDLGGWQSEAASIYQINSIPSNFLLDSKGIIIAKNLRGQTLEMELERHLK